MFSFRFTCLNVQKQHNFSHIVHCCSACFHPLSERSAFVSVPLRAPSIKAQSVMVVELSQVAIQAACISTWSVLILDSIYVTPRTSTALWVGHMGLGPLTCTCVGCVSWYLAAKPNRGKQPCLCLTRVAHPCACSGPRLCSDCRWKWIKHVPRRRNELPNSKIFAPCHTYSSSTL